jgi:hypothetical protein
VDGTHTGEKNRAYRVLMGKFEGKNLLRQSRIGGGDNIKINFKN